MILTYSTLNGALDINVHGKPERSMSIDIVLLSLHDTSE